eukprot:GFUD01023302.1.p1 GENE.GFUD01023302.1~~GFUD01023302.1.p1  ORF type:complete len:485 (+),score=197.67 GFUD01023302.1:55-1455(+)
MPRKAVRVQAVRQRGGECLGVVRERVRVEKEEMVEMRWEAVEEYQDWEEQRRRRMEDRRAVAEVRGREAEVKLARDNWMKDRMSKEEKEKRESLKLMEMLRTAKMMRTLKSVEVVECPGGGGVDIEKESHRRDEEYDKRNKRNVWKQKSQPSNNNSRVLGPDKETRRNVRKRKEENEVEVDKSEKELRRREEQKHLFKLVSPLGQLDSTEEVSCLSTIMEESEVLSPLCDSVDLVTVKDITRDDSKESSASPFPETNIVCRRKEDTDLTSVKQLLARVKMQGKVLEKTETHLMTVEGRPGGETSQSQTSKLPVTAKPFYKIDQQFVKRILEFSSSSPFSSPAPSPSPPARAPTITARVPPVTAQFIPPPPTNQPKLRYYIEKLLHLRHEDVQNLSVSSCVSSPDMQRERQSKPKTMTTSTLSLSSTSCSVKVKQHSSVTGHQVDWSSGTSGTVTSIQLTETEYENW